MAKVLMAMALVVVLAGCSGAQQGARLAGQRMVAIASDARGFAQIFEREPTGLQFSGLSSVFKKAADSGLDVLEEAGSVPQAQLVLSAMADTSANYTTLVGHNANGTFRFADGSTILLSDLAPPDGKIVAVISCESTQYVAGGTLGIPDELTYAVAFRTEQLFTAGLTVEMLSDTRSAQAHLEDSFRRAAAEAVGTKIAAFTIPGVGVAGGVVGLSVAREPG